KYKVLSYLLFLLSMCFIACSNENHLVPLERDANGTGPITDIKVENLPGGAKLTYVLPNDESLRYVVAKVTYPNGRERVFKASRYINEILLDGFGDTNTYKVEVATVNASEKVSSPIFVDIQPLTPTFLNVLA